MTPISAISAAGMQSVSGLQTGAAVQKPTSVTASKGSSSASFADTVSEFLNQVDSEYQATDTAVADLVSGKTDNVHQVVLNAARADLSFRMLLEIRNRLTDSFQEIMRMQL